ncbi:MAG: hypothetical protein EAX95_03680 [Candidatus Thorarchaeota archaeon]|nr:hypothetical protein [Candidatus Thorarchaeota archaeon]
MKTRKLKGERKLTPYISRSKAILVVGLVVFGTILAWAPWITDEYAINVVTESLGGADAMYNYLGESMPLDEVPKNVVRVPFVALVYFPSEAVYIVTFWGGVL